MIYILGFIIWCLLIWFSYVLENLMWPVKGGYYIIFEKTALCMRYTLILGGLLLVGILLTGCKEVDLRYGNFDIRMEE